MSCRYTLHLCAHVCVCVRITSCVRHKNKKLPVTNRGQQLVQIIRVEWSHCYGSQMRFFPREGQKKKTYNFEEILVKHSPSPQPFPSHHPTCYFDQSARNSATVWDFGTKVSRLKASSGWAMLLLASWPAEQIELGVWLNTKREVPISSWQLH